MITAVFDLVNLFGGAMRDVELEGEIHSLAVLCRCLLGRHCQNLGKGGESDGGKECKLHDCKWA